MSDKSRRFIMFLFPTRKLARAFATKTGHNVVDRGTGSDTLRWGVAIR